MQEFRTVRARGPRFRATWAPAGDRTPAFVTPSGARLCGAAATGPLPGRPHRARPRPTTPSRSTPRSPVWSPRPVTYAGAPHDPRAPPRAVARPSGSPVTELLHSSRRPARTAAARHRRGRDTGIDTHRAGASTRRPGGMAGS